MLFSDGFNFSLLMKSVCAFDAGIFQRWEVSVRLSGADTFSVFNFVSFCGCFFFLFQLWHHNERSAENTKSQSADTGQSKVACIED